LHQQSSFINSVHHRTVPVLGLGVLSSGGMMMPIKAPPIRIVPPRYLANDGYVPGPSGPSKFNNSRFQNQQPVIPGSHSMEAMLAMQATMPPYVQTLFQQQQQQQQQLRENIEAHDRISTLPAATQLNQVMMQQQGQQQQYKQQEIVQQQGYRPAMNQHGYRPPMNQNFPINQSIPLNQSVPVEQQQQAISQVEEQYPQGSTVYPNPQAEYHQYQLQSTKHKELQARQYYMQQKAMEQVREQYQQQNQYQPQNQYQQHLQQQQQQQHHHQQQQQQLHYQQQQLHHQQQIQPMSGQPMQIRPPQIMGQPMQMMGQQQQQQQQQQLQQGRMLPVVSTTFPTSSHPLGSVRPAIRIMPVPDEVDQRSGIMQSRGGTSSGSGSMIYQRPLQSVMTSLGFVQVPVGVRTIGSIQPTSQLTSQPTSQSIQEPVAPKEEESYDI
jgi:hypothetical protein